MIARARDILASLEQDELTRGGKPTISGAAPASQQQLGLFQAAPSPADEKLKERIREIDINRTTPLDALRIIEELKKEVEHE